MGHASLVWASRMVSWFQQGEAGLVSPVGSPIPAPTRFQRLGQTGKLRQFWLRSPVTSMLGSGLQLGCCWPDSNS